MKKIIKILLIGILIVILFKLTFVVLGFIWAILTNKYFWIVVGIVGVVVLVIKFWDSIWDLIDDIFFEIQYATGHYKKPTKNTSSKRNSYQKDINELFKNNVEVTKNDTKTKNPPSSELKVETSKAENNHTKVMNIKTEEQIIETSMKQTNNTIVMETSKSNEQGGKMKWFREIIKDKHTSEYTTLQGKKVCTEWTLEDGIKNNNDIRISFDSKGRLVEFYNEMGMKRTKIKHGNNDKIQELSEYIDIPSSDGFNTHEKHNYFYDSNGNIILYYIGESLEESKLTIKQTYLQNLISSQEITTKYSTQKLDYTYNNGRMESIIYIDESENKTEKTILHFNYIDEDRELRIESTNGWKEVRKFNEHNKIIYRNTMWSDKVIQKIKYSHDEQGNLIRKVNDGYSYIIEHKYDSQNRRKMTIVNYPKERVEYNYEYRNNIISINSNQYTLHTFQINQDSDIVASQDNSFYCKEGILFRGAYGNLYFSNKSRIKLYNDFTFFPIPVIAICKESYLIDDHDLNKSYAHDESSYFQSLVYHGDYHSYTSVFDENDWKECLSKPNKENSYNKNDYFYDYESHWDEYDEDGIPYSDYEV